MLDPVSFKLAKLLKEKGYDQPCQFCVTDEDNRRLPFNAGNNFHINSKDPYYSSPSIAEVVTWLFKIHKFWILVIPMADCYFSSEAIDIQCDPENEIERNNYKKRNYFESVDPIEAYEHAIEYCLNMII